MGTLTLLNDVLTDADDAGFLVGSSNPPPNSNGKNQSEKISSYIHNKVRIDDIVCSDADRINILIHKIRIKSPEQNLTHRNVKHYVALRERNFGVLNGTAYPLSSSVFYHSRILPENGESVMQCRSRLMDCIQDLCKTYMGKSLLVVSHPFVCQIFTNVVSQKGHVLLTNFWQQKGSFIVWHFELGSFGTKWSFQSAHNTFTDKTYTQHEIYSELLGTERALPNQDS